MALPVLAVQEAPEGATVPVSYASPAARHYGCQAPAWVQHLPRLLRAWARARALRWSGVERASGGAALWLSALGARLALATVAVLAGLALAQLARLVALAGQ